VLVGVVFGKGLVGGSTEMIGWAVACRGRVEEGSHGGEARFCFFGGDVGNCRA
jgi:hypothetical protein